MNPENKVIPSSCHGYYSHLPGQNSIPLHALQGKKLRKKKNSYDIYSGNETKTQVHAGPQALVDVLMSLHDPVIPAFARETANITKVSFSILNLESTLFFKYP